MKLVPRRRTSTRGNGAGKRIALTPQASIARIKYLPAEATPLNRRTALPLSCNGASAVAYIMYVARTGDVMGLRAVAA